MNPRWRKRNSRRESEKEGWSVKTEEECEVATRAREAHEEERRERGEREDVAEHESKFESHSVGRGGRNGKCGENEIERRKPTFVKK